MATKATTEKEQARDTLRELLADNNTRTVYTILRHVSQSGMSRDISLHIVGKDGTILDITYLAGKALGDKVTQKHGRKVLRVRGCGMDMGFHLVYSVSSVLFHGQDRAGYTLRHEWA